MGKPRKHARGAFRHLAACAGHPKVPLNDADLLKRRIQPWYFTSSSDTHAPSSGAALHGTVSPSSSNLARCEQRVHTSIPLNSNNPIPMTGGLTLRTLQSMMRVAQTLHAFQARQVPHHFPPRKGKLHVISKRVSASYIPMIRRSLESRQSRRSLRQTS